MPYSPGRATVSWLEKRKSRFGYTFNAECRSDAVNFGVAGCPASQHCFISKVSGVMLGQISASEHDHVCSTNTHRVGTDVQLTINVSLSNTTTSKE